MKDQLPRLFGFRSGTPWKKLVAILYYGVCLLVLAFGLTTRPPISMGGWDFFVYKLSAVVIFLWMLSPAIFLSDTPLRKKIPLLKDNDAHKAFWGMVIILMLFSYLFAMTESWHSPEYKQAYAAYNEQLFGATQAGSAQAGA